MTKGLVVSKTQTEKAFANWWADYLANPESFSKDPDMDGKSSADIFFDYAKKAGAEEQ